MVNSPSLRIAHSILAADFAKLGKEIKAIDMAGADWIHIDIMDGHFVPNITIGPAVVKSLRSYTKLPFDVHLMISPVDPMIEAFAEAGADTISVHPESGPNLHRTLQTIRGLKKRAGLVLNPATPINSIDQVIDIVDLILVMTVNPGFGGQKFITSQLNKIRSIRKVIDQHISKGGASIDLEVDGGIDANTSKLAIEAGADALVAGTAVFSGGPDCYAENIKSLRKNSAKGQ